MVSFYIFSNPRQINFGKEITSPYPLQMTSHAQLPPSNFYFRNTQDPTRNHYSQESLIPSTNNRSQKNSFQPSSKLATISSPTPIIHFEEMQQIPQLRQAFLSTISRKWDAGSQTQLRNTSHKRQRIHYSSQSISASNWLPQIRRTPYKPHLHSNRDSFHQRAGVS